MIGAFIGDMAYSTWKYDRKYFDGKLVSSKARPTEIMYDLLYTFKFAESYFTNKYTPLLVSIALGWIYYSGVAALRSLDNYIQYDNDETRCASHLICKSLFALRRGKTKGQVSAIRYIRTISEFANEDKYNQSDSPMGVFVKAWSAFYAADDFVSAIRNAVGKPGNKHLVCILTGALADAMNGYEIRLNELGDHFFGYRNYGVELKYILPEAMIKLNVKNRTFRPKNDMMMYVPSDDYWVEAPYPKDSIKVNRTLCEKILKKLDIYLDNGYAYIVSPKMKKGIVKFRVEETVDGDYLFKNFMKQINLTENEYNKALEKYISEDTSVESTLANEYSKKAMNIQKIY